MPTLISPCGGGGGGGLSPLYGFYNGVAQSAGAATEVTLAWAYLGGDALLDLTDTSNPKPATRGVYWVSAQCTSGTGGWTAGHVLRAQIDAINATASINGVHNEFPNFLGNIGIFSVDTLSPMETTDYFQLLILNADTGARTVSAPRINVVRIGTY